MSYLDNIKAAIVAEASRSGSTLPAIKKYVTENRETYANHQLLAALKKGVANGSIVKAKACYKIAPTAKKAAVKVSEPSEAELKKLLSKNKKKKQGAFQSMIKSIEAKHGPKKAASKQKKKPSTKKKAAPKKASPKTKKSAAKKKKSAPKKKKAAPKKSPAKKK